MPEVATVIVRYIIDMNNVNTHLTDLSRTLNKYIMDEIRDSRKSDPLTRFLDNHVVRTNPFGRNISGEKAYRRAERLVAALYLLTSHVRESEPLRQSIRRSSLALLSGVLALRNEMRSSNSHKMYDVQSTIRELISLVRLLAISGLISLQNADIMVEAADELGTFLNLSQRTPLSESAVISREGLLGDIIAAKRTSSSVKDRETRRIGQTDMTISDTESGTLAKDTQKDVADVPYSRTVEVNTRSREILEVLRSGGELGIRDIASNLPEYSEKMVQRELASLVSANIVKKTGLKRWSRYSIAGDGSQADTR